MWTLILREEHRLSMLENSMLRKIFWPRRDEVTEVWKRLHNELNSLFLPKYSGDQEQMGETCGTFDGEER